MVSRAGDGGVAGCGLPVAVCAAVVRAERPGVVHVRLVLPGGEDLGPQAGRAAVAAVAGKRRAAPGGNGGDGEGARLRGAVGVAVDPRAGPEAVGLARQEIVGRAAVAPAARERHLDAAAGDAGRVGERRAAGMALEARGGAGAEVGPVLGTGHGMPAGGGEPVALVAVAGGVEGGAPPGGSDPLEVAVHVGAAPQGNRGNRRLIEEPAAVAAARGRIVDVGVYLDRLGAVTRFVAEHSRAVALGARGGGVVRVTLVVSLECAGSRLADPGCGVERREGVAVVALYIKLRGGQRQRCREHHNSEQDECQCRPYIVISESAVALHFKLLL